MQDFNDVAWHLCEKYCDTLITEYRDWRHHGTVPEDGQLCYQHRKWASETEVMFTVVWKQGRTYTIEMLNEHSGEKSRKFVVPHNLIMSSVVMHKQGILITGGTMPHLSGSSKTVWRHGDSSHERHIWQSFVFR